MSDIFPFDHTVFINDSEGWPDCDVTLSSFQAHVEVRGYDDYSLYFCKFFKPSLREWVRPASGSEHEARLEYGASNRTGVQQIRADITTAIVNKRLGGMRRTTVFEASRNDAGDVRVREVAA